MFMSNERFIQYVESFNEGNWENFSQVFGDDLNRFLTLLKRKELLHLLDIDNIHYHDEYLVNPILSYMLKSNPNETLKFIVDKFLNDVEIREDGYYLRLRDLTELSEFFSKYSRSRDIDPRSAVESVLGEDYWDPFSNTIQDVYEEIINVLNDKNIQLLANYIIEQIGGNELSLDEYSSDLFEEISEKQGTEGTFVIDPTNIINIIKDEESLNELLSNDLSDLNSRLHWLGDDAYNISYNDMVYKNVWDSLSDIFEGDINWVEKSMQNRNSNIQVPYIKIKDFYDDVLTFLVDFTQYSDSLFDFGGYTEFKTHWMYQTDSYLDLSIDDYPDYRDVENNINVGFTDRLYD